MTQRKFWRLTALWVLSTYLGLVGAFWLGQKLPVPAAVFAVLALYLASPIAMWHHADKYEYRSFREVFNLKIGSWSFLIGDSIVLPTAAVFMVFGWHASDTINWGRSPFEVFGCLGVGVIVGLLFHAVDGNGYRSAAAQEALASPTKITHDFCAYPVLFGGLLYGGIPLVQNWNWYCWAVVGCIIAWLLLCVRDMKVGLNPKLLHPRWSKSRFTPLRWPRQ